MEGIFEALLQFLFELLLEIFSEILGEIFSEILGELPSLLRHLVSKLNLPFEISFFDEITKLNLFE